MALHLSGPLDSYVSGRSSYLSAIAEFENAHFQKKYQDQQNKLRYQEKKIRDRIYNWISKFDTGLNPRLLRKVPRLIMEEGKRYGYDPLLLTALITTESSFNNWAESHKGAVGLMQIKPKTGSQIAREMSSKWEGLRTLYDPKTNIALGTYYLNKMIKRFGGELELGLEAYNHGPSQLSKYLKEGRRPNKYSGKVIKNYKTIKAQSI